MKRMFRSVLFATGMSLAGVFALTSCNTKPLTPAGREYWYQCFWENGPSDFSPWAEFREGGVLVHHDDTATINGSWTNVDETVQWELENPPKNTKFRGTYDKKGIAGNVTDDLGGKAFFQGARHD